MMLHVVEALLIGFNARFVIRNWDPGVGGEEIEPVFWKQPNIQVLWMWQGTTCSTENSPLWLRTGGMQAAGQLVNGDDDEERIDQRFSD
ncbi:hypothetical protein M0R45_030916 [Rubus argutus]|uniref:Uncharacterized protein n=1 Tax=Rubus argutus TaxID=59490 RepID=A0AAW1WD77_RUBAR